MSPEEIEFLQESNFIEGVRDPLSLDNAVEAWKWLRKQNVMTLKVMQRTHEILMRNQPLKPHEIGAFRKVNVYIGQERMMRPEHVAMALLHEFCLPTMRVSPKPDWKALHVRYEQIHPFVDGNGRTGRMFMNWTRVRRCKQPVLVIREEEKGDYYKWFNGKKV
jgi:Fic family protein